MAPGTNLGAATPVQIGGPLPGLPDATPDKSDKDKKDGGDQQPKAKDAMTAKATNDAVALIRSLAELRGRNADWAEKAVREAASLSANAALQANVIDLVARDPAELLRQIDGRTVEIAGGETRHLATKEAARRSDRARMDHPISGGHHRSQRRLHSHAGRHLRPDLRISSPGAVAPGVIGTICLLLGLYALNMLPINYAGLGLMLLGIALLVIEAFNPTVVLGLGGVVAFVLGAVMLFELEAPGFRLSWPVIGVAAAIFIGLDPALSLGSLLTRPKRPRTRRRASHARPVRRNPRLVRERRPRLHPW